MQKPRIIATIEARMSSTRLPGKVLLTAQGKSMLELMVERLRLVPSLTGVAIATTTNSADDIIATTAQRLGVDCHRGSEDDVMERVLNTARQVKADVIVETTGDCPLIDPGSVERCIQAWLAGGHDYVANVLKRTYPIGMDTQVFATDILADAFSRTDDVEEHEHVSLFIYRHPELYRLLNLEAEGRHLRPELRLTLDEPKDYELITWIFDRLYPANPAFGLDDMVALLDAHPEMAALNRDIRHRHVDI